MKSCDNCKYYQWYYDKCERWDCEVDFRSVCSEYDGDGKHLTETNNKSVECGTSCNINYSVQCPYCGTYLSYTVNRGDDYESENYEEADFNNWEDA